MVTGLLALCERKATAKERIQSEEPQAKLSSRNYKYWIKHLRLSCDGQSQPIVQAATIIQRMFLNSIPSPQTNLQCMCFEDGLVIIINSTIGTQRGGDIY